LLNESRAVPLFAAHVEDARQNFPELTFRVRERRAHQVIQVGCNSFQHADHPRPVETKGLRMQPPSVPAEKEKKALAKGEVPGFSWREPEETERGKGRVLRRLLGSFRI